MYAPREARIEWRALMLRWSIVLCAALLLAANVAVAETQYITDQLAVPLRRGPTNGHKIIHAGLPSGTALEIVAKDDGSGFTQVRTMNGTDGWVPTQFLTSEASARDRLTAASKRIETLTAELATLRQGVKAEQNAKSTAEGISSDLSKQLKETQSELNEIRRVSANAVAVYEENKSLKVQTADLERIKNEQAIQIKALKTNEMQMWMAFGGGLVVFGFILGVIVKARPKARNGW
jgi:SH3 domain protein